MILTKFDEIINAIDNKKTFTMNLEELDPKLSKEIFDYIKLHLTKFSKIKKLNRTTYLVEL